VLFLEDGTPTLIPRHLAQLTRCQTWSSEEFAETFVGRGATRSQMFGMPVLKAGDKVFAGTFGDAMTFKLGPDDLEQARALTGVEPFEPMQGRPMKEWVLVPLATRSAGRISPSERSGTSRSDPASLGSSRRRDAWPVRSLRAR